MQDNIVQKPLSIVRSEFINSITQLVNTSTLPLVIIESVLKDVYGDVHLLCQKQLIEDTKRYNEQISQQNTKQIE